MAGKTDNYKVCTQCGRKIPEHARSNRCLSHGGSYVAKDCFAYDTQKNGCIALKELYCAKEKCNFYKRKGSE